MMGMPLQGHTANAEFLMAKGARLDMLDAFGRSGLWLAAANGYPECVRMLLRCGGRHLLDTPANAGCSETRGRTALLIAAMRGHIEVRPHPPPMLSSKVFAMAGERLAGSRVPTPDARVYVHMMYKPPW